MFKFNILFYNVILDFKENLKNIYLEKTWENGAKKQELFNCFQNACFSHFFQAHFQNAFSRMFSHCFTKM